MKGDFERTQQSHNKEFLSIYYDQMLVCFLIVKACYDDCHDMHHVHILVGPSTSSTSLAYQSQF